MERDQDPGLATLIDAICVHDVAKTSRLLAASPDLARARAADDVFLESIGHYLYGGDTALHIAAAAYQREIADELIANGADPRASNRRGAQPLHYAADGVPGSQSWDPAAQAATIAALIEAGADPDATDKSGVTPLHRAVRCRCAAGVKALLAGGADARHPNGNGSTALDMARTNSGRGGSGTAESKSQQNEIVQLLERLGSVGSR